MYKLGYMYKLVIYIYIRKGCVRMYTYTQYTVAVHIRLQTGWQTGELQSRKHALAYGLEGLVSGHSAGHLNTLREHGLSSFVHVTVDWPWTTPVSIAMMVAMDNNNRSRALCLLKPLPHFIFFYKLQLFMYYCRNYAVIYKKKKKRIKYFFKRKKN